MDYRKPSLMFLHEMEETWPRLVTGLPLLKSGDSCVSQLPAEEELVPLSLWLSIRCPECHSAVPLQANM